MKKLSIVMPYYMNPGMLQLQYANWAGWRQDLKDQIEVVLVDDGSPESQAVDVLRYDELPAIQIWRIVEDKPWNQHGARNLGAKEATGDWLLLTDMDHMLLEKDLERLLGKLGDLDRSTTYMLDRVEADTGEPTLDRHGKPKPHPNSFVMTKDHYWVVGGYDEEYCGVYGTDGLFKTRAFERGAKGHLKKIRLQRYHRDLVPDASTRTLERKEGREPGAKKMIRAQKEARGEANKIKTLQFSYLRVV